MLATVTKYQAQLLRTTLSSYVDGEYLPCGNNIARSNALEGLKGEGEKKTDFTLFSHSFITYLNNIARKNIVRTIKQACKHCMDN